MDELLKKYLMNKGGLPEDQFGEDAYAKAKADAEEQKSGLGVAQFIGGVGDAIAGRSSDATAKNFDSVRKGIDERTVGELDKRKKDYMADTAFANQQTEVADKQSRKDPNSPINQKLRASIMASTPDLAKNMGENFNQITVDDYEYIMKPHQFAEQIKSREQQAKILSGQRTEAREARQSELQMRREDKLNEKAKLSDKQVEAFTDLDNAESDLKNLLNSLGDKKHWTGPVDGSVPDLLVGDDQVAWRSAVGKYKDAYRKAITGAGAGPTEIAMLEKRLPSEYDSPDNFKAKANEAIGEIGRRRTSMAGNLSKVGKNVQSFEGAPQPKQKTVVKTQTHQKTGEKRIVYSDGTFEIVSSVAGGK